MRQPPALWSVCIAACVLIGTSPLAARTLLEAGKGTTWKYRDDGLAPDAAWRTAGFDDSAWKSGAAPLGFGETTLSTTVSSGSGKSGPDGGPREITTWFRRTFPTPKLQAGEGLVLLLCIDDGALVYLNGAEIARVNLPAGEITPQTPAVKTIGNDEEGLYRRVRVALPALAADAENVLAVEVHQATKTSSDLYFDLALKVLPATTAAAEVPVAAHIVVDLFNKKHYLGPDVRVPDGYLDGGRGMKINAAGEVQAGREILVVDRREDRELAVDLEFARSQEIRALPTVERIQRLAVRIDRKTTPPGGLRWVDETTKELEDEFTGRPLYIGDWVDQCHAGVCRHRALLFKLLADEAGLKAALVRGNFAKNGPPGFPHAWNEVVLDDGRRVIVDVMHNGGQPKFLDVTEREAIERYLRVDDTPWYPTKADGN